jgi:hypothetical protein
MEGVTEKILKIGSGVKDLLTGDMDLGSGVKDLGPGDMALFLCVDPFLLISSGPRHKNGELLHSPFL